MDAVVGILDVLTSEAFYASAVRLGGFIAFLALGELVAQRAGTINISVEGAALAGAFAGAGAAQVTGSIAAGLVAGALGGLVVAAIQAASSHRLNADQFVVGITVNLLVLGVVGYLDAVWGPVAHRAAVVEIPGLVDIPLVGPALFGQTWPTYLLYLVVPATWWLLWRTRWGLHVRAVGGDPAAAEVSGIAVNATRRQAVRYMGVAAGLGGAYLVLGQTGSFDPALVGGRGFIAIAAVSFGGWRVGAVVAGALLFGSADALRLTLPVLGYRMNAHVLAALPYLLTLAVMIGLRSARRQPAALGRPYVEGERLIPRRLASRSG